MPFDQSMTFFSSITRLKHIALLLVPRMGLLDDGKVLFGDPSKIMDIESWLVNLPPVRYPHEK